MNEIAARYRVRADIFAAKIAAVRPGEWSDPSPCEEWTAKDVVGHIVDMHGAMLGPLGRSLSRAPSVEEDPLAAFASARADIEALLDDPATAASEVATPAGRLSVEQHIDQVVSADMVVHGWDLARATGQDDTIDPAEIAAMWPGVQQIPDGCAFPAPSVPASSSSGPRSGPHDAPLQHRVLGLLGRDPHWSA